MRPNLRIVVTLSLSFLPFFPALYSRHLNPPTPRRTTMTQKRLHVRLSPNPKVIAIALTSLLWLLPSLAIAAPARGKAGAMFRPRPGEGAPAGSRGGATRGNCPQDMDKASKTTDLPPLTLLISSTSNNPDDLRTALTASERPSFLVYVPQTSATEADFTLKADVKESELRHNPDAQFTYNQIVKLTGKPGIVKITLPADQPGLAVDMPYKWSFSLICGADRGADAVAEGFVRRVVLDPSYQAQLRHTTDAIARAAIYGEAGIWYDMVAALASAQSATQSDASLATNWVTLLNSEMVNLGSVANVPLVD